MWIWYNSLLMSEYTPHDYSETAHPGLKRAMEDFEPTLAMLKNYPFRYRLLVDNMGYRDILRGLEPTFSESRFLVVEAVAEKIVAVKRMKDAPVLSGKVPIAYAPGQRGRAALPLGIELDDLRRARAIVWGYDDAGDEMDNVHNLAPAVAHAKTGLGLDSLAEEMKDPEKDYYFDAIPGRQKKTEIETILNHSENDSELENYLSFINESHH